MSSLLRLTVDAGVLAAPDCTCSREKTCQYVDTLLSWSKLLDEPWIAICLSERASETLFADSLFPLREHLSKLFQTHNIIEYDVNTVARIANQLLTITPSFETYYRVKDVLSDNLETDPDVIRLTTSAGLQADLARCITLIAVLRSHCSQPLGGHSLILRQTPSQVIQVKAQIYELEHERDDIPTLPSPPDFFEGEVLACDDFRGLIDCIDEPVLLVGALDNLAIELSIRLALFKHKIAQGENPEWTDMVAPKIGRLFRATCQTCCLSAATSLPQETLRSIVETVLGQNAAAVHAIRTSAGGGAAQRKRGNDKAQRRDIDHEFHLHYWECANGAIELASVVHHNDYTIPE